MGKAADIPKRSGKWVRQPQELKSGSRKAFAAECGPGHMGVAMSEVDEALTFPGVATIIYRNV